jgi:hypothetical protein
LKQTKGAKAIVSITTCYKTRCLMVSDGKVLSEVGSTDGKVLVEVGSKEAAETESNEGMSVTGATSMEGKLAGRQKMMKHLNLSPE